MNDRSPNAGTPKARKAPRPAPHNRAKERPAKGGAGPQGGPRQPAAKERPAKGGAGPQGGPRQATKERPAKGGAGPQGGPRQATKERPARGGKGPHHEPRPGPQQKPRPAPQQRPNPPRKPKARPVELPEGPPRSGAVALIGRANVGKSTLLNAALGQDLAITSATPQTTRDTLLGVLHRGSAELRLLDTPGLHKPKSELGRVMNHHAREAARAADVVVFVAEVPRPKGSAPLAPHPGDLTLLQSFTEAAEGAAERTPIVLALNKVDLAKDKSVLLPLLEAFAKVLSFDAIVPLSARRAGDAERLMDVVAGLCPEGPWQFEADDLTDRPARYFAAEYVREQILRATRLEVPHAAAVTVDRFNEVEGAAVEIDVTIHVERPGQKKILIGTGGETLKGIGTAARLRLKEMLGKKVILKTWVRVTPAWRASAEKLADMGYEKKRDGEQVLIFADLEDDEEVEEQ